MASNVGAKPYFVTLEDPHDLAREMKDRIRVWREYADGKGYFGLWERKINNYYGMSEQGNTSQRINAGGAEGELELIKVNDLHNLIQNQLTIVTAQRPAGIAKAVNSDVASLKASRIGTAIAEYYMSQVGWEASFVNACEIALLCDEAFVDVYWDDTSGDPIAVDRESGQPIMSGDAKIRVTPPWNASRDPGMPIASAEWFILSFRMNRYDAVAKFPKFAQEILVCGDDDLPSVPMNNIPDGSDAIYAHLLIADRSAAVPEGRYALMIGEYIVLDTKLPYKDFPVDRLTPADVIDGQLGYCAANDILAMEETTDALYSIIASNQITFGGQNIVGPTGANLKVSDIAKALRYFEVEPEFVDKFRPMVMANTPPEIFNFIQMLSNKKEQAVGSNSVVRGQPEGALAGASGSALALIQAQAISFNSGIQRSYFRLLSNTMTKLIGVLRVYADTPKVARIVGKSKSSGLKEFKYTGDDLNSVSSIVYELMNPMAQSLGGRLTFAQDLLKAGQIKSPKQYINVATTGQLDVMTEDDEADGLLILEENEWLREGKPVKAIITQMHADHIKSHTSQITLESQLEDPDFVARTLDHIQEHINLWMQASVTNPGILLATGQQPLLPPPGMMGPPPGAPQPGAPQRGAMAGGAEPPVMKKAADVKEPNLPKVAGTEQRAQVPGVTNLPPVA